MFYISQITRSDSDLLWARDNRTIFWIERDDNQRPCFVYAMDTEDADARPTLVYKEADAGMFVSVDETDGGEYIEIQISNHTTTEVRLIPSKEPMSAARVFATREEDNEYSICEAEDGFFILTNYQSAVDFKIMRCPRDKTTREHWTDYEPHRAGRLILSVTRYKGHLVRVERENALPRLVVTDLATNASHDIAFDEAAYSLHRVDDLEFDTAILRFKYSSPVTPAQVREATLWLCYHLCVSL